MFSKKSPRHTTRQPVPSHSWLSHFHYLVGYDGSDFWTNPFVDVSTGDWYFASVEYAVKNGLFAGTSDVTFEPQTPMTRAMFVTVLARMYGAELSGYTESGFGDVPIDSWYGASVSWAAEKE